MKKFLRGLLNILLFPFRVIKNMFLKKKETTKNISVETFLNHIKELKAEKIDFKALYTNENEKIDINYTAPVKSPVTSLKTSENEKQKKALINSSAFSFCVKPF